MDKVPENTTYARLFRKIHHRVGKAIHEYQLISEGDTIAIGLSGGKDSLSLLDILSGRIKYSGVNFQLAAIHVNITSIPYLVDIGYLKQFCEEREVPFYLIEADLPETENDRRNTCFVCSWNRRKILFREIQKMGFSKLALGHHKDDAVETLLMNMAFQGSISSMPPKLKLFGEKIEIIRPLITLNNETDRVCAQKRLFSGNKEMSF
ncbi:MAG TPA: tRNA 2-thiocytidine(32) synthetase TtcA [Prolixibacteraceae bacterium]|nr:tRNA 2-thiocytidine(32) synthetase TtcA [Prolixibacteraceae bacterium]HCR90989.1 tRNA 2-thiocytidine(32) synthetase TtcA [Prolixibacteraceae bacterium]HCU62395.1 tRNA 2-thiocytidine(32) synthetase TtcA [Prolixibacteraceae bacterium]